jgi:hypothetical protein|tara:strand:- start:1625 stop:1747 length:123 start_codon:yes stop_codon:yes gene_type:complete
MRMAIRTAIENKLAEMVLVLWPIKSTINTQRVEMVNNKKM